MIGEGDKAPQFELDAAGEDGSTTTFSLKEALSEAGAGKGGGKAIVLYFYPRDSTPGCTREAQAFAEAKKKLAAAGALVVGVSKDSIKSHCGFREKYGLNFPLLSDPDLSVHRAYGAYGEKTMYGKKVLGTIRSTFLIASDGKVSRAWRNVKVDGHVNAVLEALDGGTGHEAPKTSKTAARKASKKAVAKKRG